jgi:polysaccharide chain length determinant protein (PEP-CTERM system associated)
VVSILKKRWWLLALPPILLGGAAAVSSLFIANRYQSQTVILVVPQRIPETYVRPTVSAPLEGRLPTLAQQVLSRTRLERIMTDFDLFSDLRRESMDEAVRKMRAAITPQVARNNTSFSLSFTYGDPQLAAKVTDRLASLFIEENYRDREVIADNTTAFLEAQLEEARQRLEEVEKQREAYKRAHAGELPEQITSNMQMITSLNAQIQTVADQLNRVRDRSITLKALISDLSIPLPTPPPVLPAANGVAATATLTTSQQLDQARQEFRDVSTRFTREHPDYPRLAKKVAELEQKLRAEQAEHSANSTEPRPVATASAADVARSTRLSELKAEQLTVDRQISQYAEHEQSLRAELVKYQQRVEATPTRESGLTALNRDYATLHENYRSLLVKKQESQLASSLERRQVGEQFKVLDPASIPERHVSPNRPLIAVMGAVVGVLVGAVITVILELRDTSVYVVEDVMQAFSLPVVAMIPTAVKHKHRAARGGRLSRLFVRSAAWVWFVLPAVYTYVGR